MNLELKDRYYSVKKDISYITKKESNFTIKDLEDVMKIKFKCFKVDLKDINCIMKKKYKLYHKNSNTPRSVSEEVISDEHYVGTYIILNNSLTEKDKSNIYKDRAFMVASKDKITPYNFAEFNCTKEICMYLEILCNHTIEQLLERIK